jgi:hypothetical protein
LKQNYYFKIAGFDMFYSIRMVLLASLAFSAGMHAMQDTKEQFFSFLKGVAPVTVSMGVGYFAGKQVKHEYVGTTFGALSGMALDHYYLGGKEDKNQAARKSGNVVPVVIAGGLFYYNAKIGRLLSKSEITDDIPSSSINPLLSPLNLEKDDAELYEKLKAVVFGAKGEEYAAAFNQRHSIATKSAVHELADHIQNKSSLAWQETCPPRADVTIASQGVHLDGQIGTIIQDYLSNE